MTSSATLSSVAPTRSPRRLGVIALVSLALIGVAAPSAFAEPDTNIQKPGHIAVN